MLENYKKAKKSIEVQNNLDTQKPSGKTLSDILKNQKESAMLAGFLTRDGKVDLANRLALGQIIESDIDILEEYRINNNEALQQVESLERTVNARYLEKLAETSPEFQKIINLVGSEKASKVIQMQLQEVAVSDPYRFGNIHQSLTRLNEYQSGEVKSFENSLRNQSEKFNTDDAEVARILAIDDIDERDEAMQEHVKSQYGFFRKGVDFIAKGKFSRNAAEALSDNKEEMDRVSNELDQCILEMGNALHALVSENEQVRTSFAKELIEEKQVKKEPEPGFAEIKTEKQKIDTDWNNFKSSQNFETASISAKASIRSQFKHEAKQKNQNQEPKKGLWSRIWNNIFDRAVDDKELN